MIGFREYDGRRLAARDSDPLHWTTCFPMDDILGTAEALRKQNVAIKINL